MNKEYVESPEKIKAKELIDKYRSQLNTATPSLNRPNHQAKQCSIIAVDEIIDAISAFGYANCIYDDFYTNQMTNTDKQDPSQFWYDVKNEIEKL